MGWTQAGDRSHVRFALAAMCMALVAAAAAGAEEGLGADEGAVAAEEASVRSDAAADAGDQAAAEADFPVPPIRTSPQISPDEKRPVSPEGDLPGLDALLHLPSNFVSEEPRAVAGAGESVWRRRFEKADKALADSRVALAATRKELEGVAETGGASQWSIAAPGGGGDSGGATSPLSFRLRQQLRGDRERLDQTEKARKELQIEADLAGVPQRWRTSSATPTDPQSN